MFTNYAKGKGPVSASFAKGGSVLNVGPSRFAKKRPKFEEGGEVEDTDDVAYTVDSGDTDSGGGADAGTGDGGSGVGKLVGPETTGNNIGSAADGRKTEAEYYDSLDAQGKAGYDAQTEVMMSRRDGNTVLVDRDGNLSPRNKDYGLNVGPGAPSGPSDISGGTGPKLPKPPQGVDAVGAPKLAPLPQAERPNDEGFSQTAKDFFKQRGIKVPKLDDDEQWFPNKK